MYSNTCSALQMARPKEPLCFSHPPISSISRGVIMRLTAAEDFIIELLKWGAAFAVFPLLFWLWYGKAKTKHQWIVKAVLVSSVVALADQITWWSMVSHYFRPVSMIILILTILFSYRKNRKLPWRINGYKTLLFPTLGIILVVGLSYFLLSCVKARIYDEQAINVEFPLKNGVFTLVNGGNGKEHIMNYHLFGKNPPPGNGVTAMYAMDFRKLSWLGNEKTNIAFSNSLESYEMYDQPVYSPCNGVVIAAQKNAPDRVDIGGMGGAQGNYVIIKPTDQEKFPYPVVVMMAHFKHESLTVSLGDNVRTNQIIARVGASGTSKKGTPTLHMQANEYSASGLCGIFGKPIPITFNGRFLVKNDLIIIKN